MTESADQQVGAAPIDALLAYIKRTRGFDFTGYKRTSLERRIRKRMDEIGARHYSEYVDYLEVHQDEFAALFDTILINVTAFFRDPQSWEYYMAEVVPRMLDEIRPGDPIRVWCAGCASGEETYTMAMVLAEALGEEAYKQRVKIYATEVDEDALVHARHGVYTAKDVEPVPPPLLERYFDRGDQRYSFRKDFRRTVIFGRNDLTQDAPISRIDLLTCRNTLMYFNAETQARILGRFHYALNPWGYLFLGKSEMLISHADLFRPVNLKRRVFAKVAKPTLRDRLVAFAHTNDDDDVRESVPKLSEAVFETSPGAHVVVDGDGVVVMVNAQARSLFGLSFADIGRPLKDLELSYRPVDLRSNLELADRERRAVTLHGVSLAAQAGDPLDLEVVITPLQVGERTLGASIVYNDATGRRRIEEDLKTSRRELENVYEELQSTVEELETTNEELQSTNEELETMNDELRQRSVELNQVNGFLETMLSSIGGAVIVVDRDQTVQIWNSQSADLWGMRGDEAQGQHLLGLDIGLPLDAVRSALRRVLAGADARADVVLDAVNRRGRAIRVKVTALPLTPEPGEVTGAVLLTTQVDGDGADGGPPEDG